MNKRGRKKVEKMKRQRVHKILDAVLDVNGLGERRIDKTGNLPTAFFGFRGHVGVVTVEIHAEGWSLISEKEVDLWEDIECLSSKEVDKIVFDIRKYQKCPAM